MSDRSVVSALSFVVVVAGLTFHQASAAYAVDEDHGNPGQFIDNIRKGLSGLSKYFWSPKAPAPGEIKTPKASGEETVVPVAKAPNADAPMAPLKQAAKPAMTNPTPVEKKQVRKPAQVIKPDHKAARIQASPETTFESKAVIDGKKKMTDTKMQRTAATKPELSAQPAVKVAKPVPGTPKSGARVASAPRDEPAQKAQGSLLNVPANPASAVAPTGQTGSNSKAVGQKNAKVAPEPETGKLTIGKPAATSTKANASSLEKTTVMAMDTVRAKSPEQQLVANDKGTYIWVPNIGSQLSQRFGLTGIPAKSLQAMGNLNRTDGRWVFAPKKTGQLPGVYGLSAEIHAAGDAGVWVGGGRNWVYVFDKDRSYGSIVGGSKARKTAASKLANSVKPVASLKAGATEVPKSTASKKADKSAKTLKNDKPEKTVKAAKNDKAGQTVKTMKTVKSGPAKLNTTVKPPKGIEVQKPVQKIAQAAPKQNTKKPLNKSAVQANAGVNAARNGKWSRVNDRWVFVPQSRPGETASGTMKGLAEQVAKAPVTGGWVQRNGRWVYVAPRPKKSASPITGVTGSRKTSTDKAANDAQAAPAKAPNKGQEKPRKKAEPKADGKIPGIALVEKPRAKQAPQTGRQSGLAEGPEASQPQITKTQKIWVRKNNRWVYMYATPANSGLATAKPGQPLAGKGPRMAVRDSARQSAAKQNAGTRAGKKPDGEFMFFVPGNIPGTGSWFVAPLPLLDQAKKIKSPAYGAGR